MAENVKEINASDFTKIINDKKNTLVVCDFYAEWCMPCVMMGPVMESIASKNKNVKFIKINVDEAGSLASEFEISSIPCIVFFKNGKEVDRVIGAVNEEHLEEKIQEYFN